VPSSLSGGAVDTEGERRPLTFPLCDLVDSTALFEQLDPEDVRQVQNAVRRLFSRLAAMHDGYVAEYVGDGSCCTSATAGPGERSRASGPVRARDGRQVGSVRRTMRLSAPLAVRVAIHTDQATLGPVSPDDDRHWAAYGVATSITGRLQKNAPPGGGRRNGRDLGVDARMLHRALTRAGRAGRGVPADHRMAGGGQVPEHDWDDERHTAALFVGREREQHLVDELWRAAILGETHFALLRGEPGMGKSRLARHWCDVVAPTGANVVVARRRRTGATTLPPDRRAVGEDLRARPRQH
jgi:class 3 adenylate cyclase